MSESFPKEIFRDLPLGGLRYFASLDSTNDQAMRWAEAGASHLSLVVADEQTAGRGRLGRRWFTPPGAALAFSLVLRPEFLRFNQPDGLNAQDNPIAVTRLTALGAVAVCSAFQVQFGLSSQIKWPNDVLLAGRKACGVLAEAHWQGDHLQAVILGIGINIASNSLPLESDLLFPATCMEAEVGQPVDRWQCLVSVLDQLLGWLPRLNAPEFLSFWEGHLAYRGEQVRLSCAGSSPIEGQLLGLDSQGCLCVQTLDGRVIAFQAGEIHLRPLTGWPIRLN